MQDKIRYIPSLQFHSPLCISCTTFLSPLPEKTKKRCFPIKIYHREARIYQPAVLGYRMFLLTLWSNSALSTALWSAWRLNCWTCVSGFRAFSGTGIGSLHEIMGKNDQLVHINRHWKVLRSSTLHTHEGLAVLWISSSGPLLFPSFLFLPFPFAFPPRALLNSPIGKVLVLCMVWALVLVEPVCDEVIIRYRTIIFWLVELMMFTMRCLLLNFLPQDSQWYKDKDWP